LFIDECFECLESDLTDMVFDAFGVEFGLVGGDSDLDQKVNDCFVSSEAFFGEIAAGWGEFDGLTGNDGDEPFALESIEGFCDGGLSDAEGRDQICGADKTTGFGVTEAVDQLDVVFGDFGLVILASANKWVTLLSHLAYYTSS
jgi:hypothetical protein